MHHEQHEKIDKHTDIMSLRFSFSSLTVPDSSLAHFHVDPSEDFADSPIASGVIAVPVGARQSGNKTFLTISIFISFKCPFFKKIMSQSGLMMLKATTSPAFVHLCVKFCESTVVPGSITAPSSLFVGTQPVMMTFRYF